MVWWSDPYKDYSDVQFWPLFRYCWVFPSSWLRCSSPSLSSFQSKSIFAITLLLFPFASKIEGTLYLYMCFPSSLDKALHSAGISSGFIIFGTNLTNPLNELLLVLQPVSLSSSHAVKRWFCLIKTHLKPYFLTSIIINPRELQRSSILCCPITRRWLWFDTG